MRSSRMCTDYCSGHHKMSVLGVCIEGGLPREGVSLEGVFVQTEEGLPDVLFL